MSAAVRPGVLVAPGFVRLWVAGGLSSAMMWLEVLAAALFTLTATGSPFAVALVSAARAAPLLLVGAFVGVLADARDRRWIVMGGMALTALASATVAGLAALGVLRPWHVGAAALVSGLVYATEMPARRRLIAETAGPDLVARAVAVDGLTSFATRCAGPVLGGLATGAVGIGGAYAISAVSNLLAAGCVAGVAHTQIVRKLSFAAAWGDLLEGLAFVRRSRAVRSLLSVTTVMNLLGYAYMTLVAPVGASFRMTDVAIGILAAAEPAGALIGGLVLVRIALPGSPLLWQGVGAGAFMVALAVTPLAVALAPPLWSVGGALLLGGLGVAVYTNMQLLIAMREVPAPLRSRVLGLVSVCVGFWPVGQVVAGGLAEASSPLLAMAALGLTGLVSLGLIGLAMRGR
jgi:MFS family permease